MEKVYLIDAGTGVPILLQRSLKHYGKRLEINGLWSNLKGYIALMMHMGAKMTKRS